MLTPDEIAKLPSSKIGLREPVEALRMELGRLAKQVFALKVGNGPVQQIADHEDRGEGIANVMLAYRALEDARMRLGKVIQAADGGKSIYDK